MSERFFWSELYAQDDTFIEYSYDRLLEEICIECIGDTEGNILPIADVHYTAYAPEIWAHINAQDLPEFKHQESPDNRIDRLYAWHRDGIGVRYIPM